MITMIQLSIFYKLATHKKFCIPEESSDLQSVFFDVIIEVFDVIVVDFDDQDLQNKELEDKRKVGPKQPKRSLLQYHRSTEAGT